MNGTSGLSRERDLAQAVPELVYLVLGARSCFRRRLPKRNPTRVDLAGRDLWEPATRDVRTQQFTDLSAMSANPAEAMTPEKQARKTFHLVDSCSFRTGSNAIEIFSKKCFVNSGETQTA